MKYTSIDKAVSILNCFTGRTPQLSVKEISKMTGFTLSTVSRILSTLASRGVVETSLGYGCYRVGYSAYLWGRQANRTKNLCDTSKPIMRALSEKCWEGISLFVISDDQRVCIERINSLHAIGLTVNVGQKFPLYAGAGGQILLAHFTPEKIEDYINNLKIEKFTPNTITDPRLLEKKLDIIRRQGFAISKGERELDAYSIVAPIKGEGKQVVACISIGGPLYRLSDKMEQNFLEYVLAAAEKISKKLT